MGLQGAGQRHPNGRGVGLQGTDVNMDNNHRWKIDEDEEQAGKQLIISRENVNGFNAQREGHGSLPVLLLAILIPILMVLIAGLLIH